MAIKTYIPNTGRNLIAQAIASGKAIIFTGAEIGTGTAGNESAIMAYTSLVNKYDNAMIGTTQYVGDATCKFAIQYQTSGIQTTVQIKEIGIYAKVDGGSSSVLFSYTNFGDEVDRLFPNSEASIYRVYDVTITFTQSAGGVVVTISPDALLRASQASDTATADKLLYVGSDGKMHVSITGDAATLGGHASSYFSKSSHTHSNATQSAAGFESAADKTNLDTLVSRVNQDLKNNASPTFAGLTVNGFIEGAVFH